MARQYRQKINRVIDHVSQDPSRPYSLEDLACLCHTSKYHFHRVFKAITGETVNQLCTRLRLEKAAGRLIYNKKVSITEIALDYGFSSSANFSKAFHNHYAFSPTQYRNSKVRHSKALQPKNSNIGKAVLTDNSDNGASLITPSQIFIDNKPARYRLAYIRNKGLYKPDDITEQFGLITSWAANKQILEPNSPLILVNWSDTFIAQQDNWTYDVAVVVRDNCQGENDILIQTLENQCVVCASCWIKPSDFTTSLQLCWDYLLGNWLADSEYQPAHKPSYEIYGRLNRQGEQSVILVLPIEPIL